MKSLRTSFVSVGVLAGLVGMTVSPLAQVQAARPAKVTLTMWVHSDPNYERIANQFAAKYQKKTGVKISLNFFPWGTDRPSSLPHSPRIARRTSSRAWLPGYSPRRPRRSCPLCRRASQRR